MRVLTGLPLIALMFAPTLASAQEEEPLDEAAQETRSETAEEETDACGDNLNCITITAERRFGDVEAAQEPVQTLDAEDIAAYGAGSIAELVQQLGPAVNSGGARGGGPPAILLNGVRISGFRELRNFPPEAIERVEILPEETAVRFGFSPNQRVINFILKDNFTAKTVEVEAGGSTAGGYSRREFEASALNIRGSTRISLAVEGEQSDRLTEDERGLDLDTAAGGRLATDPDPAEFRTLIPERDELSLNGTVAVPVGEGGKNGALSVNGTITRSSFRSLSGLDSVALTDPLGNTQVRTLADPLETRGKTVTGQLGSSYSAPVGDWQLSTTFDATHSKTSTRIDRRADTATLQALALAGSFAIDGDLPQLGFSGVDFARSTTNRVDADVTMIGRPILLPSGEILLTLNSGFTYNDIRSDDTRSGVGEVFLDRTRYSAKATVAIPITSVDEGFGAFLGDMTLDVSGGIDELSDFGSLYNWSASLNWRPFESIGLTATYQSQEQAPSLSNLGNPRTETFNVPVFDLVRGETALVTVIGGGNPALQREKQRDWKFAFNYTLPFVENGRFQVEYFTNNSDNVTNGFPTLTPEIEAAFPGRVTRDATGRLTSLDRRPVTFAERNSRSLRFSLNLSGPFGAGFSEEEMAARQARQSGPPGMGGPPRGGPPSRGGGTPSSGGPTTGAPAEGAQPPGAGQRRGPPGGGGGMFSPERMQELRTRLCSDDPEKFLANLREAAKSDNPPFPPQMLERLKGEDGELDPQRVEFVRQRFCRAGDEAQQGPSPEDRARMEALRTRICGLEPQDFLSQLREEAARSEEGTSEDNRPLLPSFLLQQLKDEEGNLDPEKVEAFRQRICATGEQQAEGEGGEGRQGARRGGGGRPQGGRGGARRGGGGPFGGGDGRGRFFSNVNYTLRLADEVLVSPVGPTLDLLDGDALAGGGSPRHEFRAFGGMFYRGFGGFLSLNYTGETRVDGSGLPGGTDLFYGDLFTVGARFFVDFNQRESWVEAVPFLDDSRISFSIQNVFDTRRVITDQNGDVPIAFQPDRIDPIGRFIEIDFRKAF